MLSTYEYSPLGVGEGSRIAGRFSVSGKIGSGTFGAVFKAIDRKHGKNVIALKLLDPKLTADEAFVSRFKSEMPRTIALQHKNIVKTFDFGQSDTGNYLLTSELIEGTTLDRIIQSPRYQPSFHETLSIIHDIARALRYSHDLGIIHGNLKPSNILVSSDGKIKVNDFRFGHIFEISKRFMTPGERVSSPFYLAPEQIEDQVTDHRIDLYSLGIIAYELMFGVVPFISDQRHELALQIIRDPIPDFADQLNQIPLWFQHFVQMLTSKEKEDRLSSAHEVIKVLDEHLPEKQAVTIPATSQVRMRRSNPLLPTVTNSVGTGAAYNLLRLTPILLVASLFLLLSIAIIGVKNSPKATPHDYSDPSAPMTMSDYDPPDALTPESVETSEANLARRKIRDKRSELVRSSWVFNPTSTQNKKKVVKKAIPEKVIPQVPEAPAKKPNVPTNDIGPAIKFFFSYPPNFCTNNSDTDIEHLASWGIPSCIKR